MRSKEIGYGIYQFEFMDNHIAVVKWNEPPKSTIQWVSINSNNGVFAKYNKFYLEGTNIDNISVVPIEEEIYANK